MSLFAFRVNGNKDIGMGHVMRSLHLAQILEENPLFLINQNEKIISKVKDFGALPCVLDSVTEDDFPVMVNALEQYPRPFSENLPSEKRELEEIISIVKREGVKVLVTDLIFSSENYLQTLKETGVYLVCIDEFGSWTFPSDLVFNCNAVSQTKKYKTASATKVYTGSQYALLGRKFCQKDDRHINRDVKRILVTLGGTDMKGLSLKVIRALKSFENFFEVVLVVGPDFKFRKELSLLLEEYKNVIVKEDVRDMFSWMQSSDLAIAAGGTTMYELAAIGTPGIILGQYEHQNEFTMELAGKNAVVSLGLGESVSEASIQNTVLDLLSYDRRFAMSHAGKNVIDGGGALRVAQIIREFLH